MEIGGERYNTSAVTWDGDVEIDSRALLVGPTEPEQRSSLDDATSILEGLVDAGGGQVEVAEAKRVAADNGHSGKTMQRARNALDLEYHQEGFGREAGRWWRRKGPTPVVSTVDKVSQKRRPPDICPPWRNR